MFKSKVIENDYGKALVATEDLPVGTVVEAFEGDIIIPYAQVPEEEKCYAICVGDAGEDKWMLYKTNARYANHSCDPNCFVGDDLKIVTIKEVKKGEELTYSYNTYLEEDENVEDFLWDPQWNFECKCGAKNCQKIIQGYVKGK
jgi:uncharacterized protein